VVHTVGILEYIVLPRAIVGHPSNESSVFTVMLYGMNFFMLVNLVGCAYLFSTLYIQFDIIVFSHVRASDQASVSFDFEDLEVYFACA
jgi:hypothetical protein